MLKCEEIKYKDISVCHINVTGTILFKEIIVGENMVFKCVLI